VRRSGPARPGRQRAARAAVGSVPRAPRPKTPSLCPELAATSRVGHPVREHRRAPHPPEQLALCVPVNSPSPPFCANAPSACPAPLSLACTFCPVPLPAPSPCSSPPAAQLWVPPATNERFWTHALRCAPPCWFSRGTLAKVSTHAGARTVWSAGSLTLLLGSPAGVGGREGGERFVLGKEGGQSPAGLHNGGKASRAGQLCMPTTAAQPPPVHAADRPPPGLSPRTALSQRPASGKGGG
jgi:hypothetical protein